MRLQYMNGNYIRFVYAVSASMACSKPPIYPCEHTHTHTLARMRKIKFISQNVLRYMHFMEHHSYFGMIHRNVSSEYTILHNNMPNSRHNRLFVRLQHCNSHIIHAKWIAVAHKIDITRPVGHFQFTVVSFTRRGWRCYLQYFAIFYVGRLYCGAFTVPTFVVCCSAEGKFHKSPSCS